MESSSQWSLPSSQWSLPSSHWSVPGSHWSVPSSNGSVSRNNWSVPRKSWSHKNVILVTKRVDVAPFELKLGPNESYGRTASVGIPPGAKKVKRRTNIIIKLPIHRPWRPLCYVTEPLLDRFFWYGTPFYIAALCNNPRTHTNTQLILDTSIHQQGWGIHQRG